MADREWYKAVEGQPVGPLSEEEIVADIRDGRIDGSTLVFTAGMTGWAAAREAPLLAGQPLG